MSEPIDMGWMSLTPELQEAIERGHAAHQISNQGLPCPNCGEPFAPADSRWLCPHCHQKIACCEGAPLQLEQE